MLFGNITCFVPCMIGTTELLLIGGLVLLLFGGKKLPELMKGMGQGIRSFKQGLNEPIKEDNPVVDNEVKLPEETTSEKNIDA
jgi:sec-independent protein translocase protein TatA